MKQKQVEYIKYGDQDQYDDMHSPQYCDRCKKVVRTEIEEADHIVEYYIDIYCSLCRLKVNIWGYGHFRKNEYGEWG